MAWNFWNCITSRRGLKWLTYCSCVLTPIKFILLAQLELPVIYDMSEAHGTPGTPDMYLVGSCILLISFGLPSVLLYIVLNEEDNDGSTKYLQIWLAVKATVTFLNIVGIVYIVIIELKGSVDIEVIINCVVWRPYELLEIVVVSGYIAGVKVLVYSRMEEPPDYVTVTDPTNQFKFPVLQKEDASSSRL